MKRVDGLTGISFEEVKSVNQTEDIQINTRGEERRGRREI